MTIALALDDHCDVNQATLSFGPGFYYNTFGHMVFHLCSKQEYRDERVAVSVYCMLMKYTNTFELSKFSEQTHKIHSY